jgi:8-oxo-dGTP diphosphatase
VVAIVSTTSTWLTRHPTCARYARSLCAPVTSADRNREHAFRVLCEHRSMPEASRWPTDRAGVLVIRDGRLALIQRQRDGETYYVVPGGSIEPGETREEAARREALEELGVDIELGPLRICIDHQTRGAIQRQWYFEATVHTDEIAVSGPELTRSPDRGTYTATWVGLDELGDHSVHPPVVADLARRHRVTWPATVIEIIEH